jgi:DNA ligase D-like protein (predicted 3'-phosphoesterase)
MSSNGLLQGYRKRRDFAASGEPRGKQRRSKRGSKRKPRFVIQEHDASTLHYDFRLEADGVLKSWAVPKGPSTDPADKRLAVPTEDHPLDYADFEGVIPPGQYGAGAVIVWDAGTYRDLGDGEISVGEQLRRGHLAFWLDGEKLRGGYALTRIAEGDDERWLLVKMDDDEADARRKPVRTQRKSILSGRTVRQVAEQEGSYGKHRGKSVATGRKNER